MYKLVNKKGASSEFGLGLCMCEGKGDVLCVNAFCLYVSVLLPSLPDHKSALRLWDCPARGSMCNYKADI